eukprot:13731125-Ditylum_brightwellii.AAC.1
MVEMERHSKQLSEKDNQHSKVNSQVPIKNRSLVHVGQTAAENSSKILEECSFDICNLIERYKGSHINYGSEFRDTKVREPLLEKHPLWPTAKLYLNEGIQCQIDDILEEKFSDPKIG